MSEAVGGSGVPRGTHLWPQMDDARQAGRPPASAGNVGQCMRLDPESTAANAAVSRQAPIASMALSTRPFIFRMCPLSASPAGHADGYPGHGPAEVARYEPDSRGDGVVDAGQGRLPLPGPGDPGAAGPAGVLWRCQGLVPDAEVGRRSGGIAVRRAAQTVLRDLREPRPALCDVRPSPPVIPRD